MSLCEREEEVKLTTLNPEEKEQVQRLTWTPCSLVVPSQISVHVEER